jgi:CheY-like chemotaxis protein
MQNERPLTGYRVLIIEDEVMQAWGLSGMVADLGGTVGSIAYSDEQARQVLNQQSFDCVILDLNLDGIYAYPITSLLQQLGIPFVFCTAYAESVDVFRGVSDVPRLNKPVLAADLRDAILLVTRPKSPQYS